MILIDKQKLFARIENEYDTWEDYDVEQALGDIEDAPEVEAIPIEWIMNEADNLMDANKFYTSFVIKGIIAKWLADQKGEEE